LLRGLADEGLSVLLVVHDLALAAAVADTVVVMHGGRTVITGRPEGVLTPDRLREVWGVDAELDAHGALRVDWLNERGPRTGPSQKP
jgi:iron complex transport system ATP-binding protein